MAIMGTVIILLIAAGVWFQRSIFAPLSQLTGQMIPRPHPISQTASAHPQTSSSATAVAIDATSSTLTPLPSPTPTPLPTLSGRHRINVLLLGSDTDAKFGKNIITQIMIVASIDPVHHTIEMLSIPRDFWVPIPGHGMDKIQIAYAYGQNDHPHGGGIALARQTVEDDFGIPIDHYAWVGLAGFIRIINTAGGINIDVIHPILDDNYPADIHNGKVSTVNIYAYRRLYIPAGPQHLDGATALEYVRSRHADLIGDFGRSVRQQQVLRNLRLKLQSPLTLLRLPQYLNDLNGYLRTDFSITDLLAYGNFLRENENVPIKQMVLMPPTYSATQTITANGLIQDIVSPDWAAVHQLIARQFASPSAPLTDPVSPQVLRIGVENGTSLPGLAARAASFLESIGYTVDPARSARRADYTSSEVLVYSPKAEAYARMIALPFDAKVVDATGQQAPYGEDLVVVLGQEHGTFEGF
ncbi:MAG: LCP family protein [Chloroflexi bacterium]|nr:LCP family protein [Chloroflexota bacterium]